MEGRSCLGTALKAILSILLLVIGVYAILGVVAGTEGDPGDEPAADVPADSEEAAPDVLATIASYGWDELSRISGEIASAGGGEASVAVAASYGLVNEDGSLTGDVKLVTLSDGTTVGFKVMGICHDVSSETGAPVGLTLVSDAAIAQRPMNANGDNAGGWEGSDLRAWLAGEGMGLLPEDLRSVMVAVDKPTNNVGSAWDESQVSVTSDKLWLLSATEVCGTIDWYATEYPPEYSFWDDVANAEGSQYQLFREGGVSSHEGGPVAVRSWAGHAVPWWYRSAFFFVYEGLEGRYYYCAMDSGYPYSYASPDVSQGVVVGLCI